MGLSRVVFSSFLLTVALMAGEAPAQGSLEIIPLRHRTADQVLPALRPLMEPGATLTGQGTQLIVRTSFDDSLDSAAQGVETSGRITNRGSSVEVRTEGRQSAAVQRVDQRVQVLDGGRAFISAGRTSPIYDGTALRETSTGFEAIPRLARGGVVVEIAQHRDTPGRQQALSTSVSGRLGEWLEVGGALETAARDDRSILSARSSRDARSSRVWLKVDELKP